MGKHYSTHDYCRILLAQVMADVRKKYTAEEIRAAWAWETSGGVRHTYEFHGPHGEYRHNLGGACCMWSAKAEGWSQIIYAGETLTEQL
jgi:hypothetical protein